MDQPVKSRFGARLGAVLGIAAIVATVAILFLTAPVAGDFQYSDAPRHALNGAFFLDFFRDHPFGDPAGWAAAYYVKYPALTIMFYPPLFHLVEAGMFALFGVSHPVAQLTVSLFALLGAAAAYLIARRLLSPAMAVAAAILWVAMPIAAFWGRQVMLDIPATAVMLAAVAAFLRYGETREARWLYVGVTVLALALYIKQPIAFIAAPLAWLLWREKLLFRRATLWSALLFGVLVLPLAVITLKFGRFNAVSVADTTPTHGPLALYYLTALPRQLGWPLFVTALVAIPLALVVGRARPPQPMGGFLVVWAVVGVIFFTAIGLKSDRFDLPALFPLVLLTLWAIAQALSEIPAATIAAVLAGGTLAYTLAFAPVPTVGGFTTAANLVMREAEPGAAVLFSGKHDGAFIFDMRALAGTRHDLEVIRAEKLFFEMAVSPKYGIKTLRDLSEAQILDMLNALNVRIAVIQPNYLSDEPVMQRLQKVLASPDFVELGTIPLKATVYGAEDKSLVVYRNVSKPSPEAAQAYDISLPIIGRTINLKTHQAIVETTGCLFCTKRSASPAPPVPVAQSR